MSDEKIVEILRFMDWRLSIDQWNKILPYIDIEEIIIENNDILFVLHSKIGNLLNGIKVYLER